MYWWPGSSPPPTSYLDPDAEVAGQHVHQAQPGDKLPLVDVHLLVEEYEVPGDGHVQCQ